MPQVPSSNGRRFQRLALENTERILHLSDRIGFFCFLCSGMKSVYLFLSWSQTINVWAKLQTPFFWWFQIHYALEDSGGREFLSKTLRYTVYMAWLFTLQGCVSCYTLFKFLQKGKLLHFHNQWNSFCFYSRSQDFTWIL